MALANVLVCCTGPLLYHYADMDTESSIELSWVELRSVIEKIGFTIDVRCTFCTLILHPCLT